MTLKWLLPNKNCSSNLSKISIPKLVSDLNFVRSCLGFPPFISKWRAPKNLQIGGRTDLSWRHGDHVTLTPFLKQVQVTDRNIIYFSCWNTSDAYIILHIVISMSGVDIWATSHKKGVPPSRVPPSFTVECRIGIDIGIEFGISNRWMKEVWMEEAKLNLHQTEAKFCSIRVVVVIRFGQEIGCEGDNGEVIFSQP